MTEALAVRDGLRLACDKWLHNVIIEIDAKDVVDLWKKRDEGRSKISSVQMDIEGMIGVFFIVFVLAHVGR